MKILIITLWALLPLSLVAYHYGPGQDRMALDDASHALSSAETHLADENWPAAITDLESALGALPADRDDEARRIRLELSKAKMESGGLPEARAELASLLEEIDPAAEPGLHSDTLAALANARFYMTYLMKLEGLPDTDWEPEIEAARQERKLLHQRAVEAGDTVAAARHADDLESAIKLARMEPAELYGKAIPRQCQNCKSGKCNNPGPKPAQKPEDNRGASSGPPIDGQGS